jgi:hypothetical protein
MDSYNPSGLTQEEINKLHDNDIPTFTSPSDVPEERRLTTMEDKTEGYFKKKEEEEQLKKQKEEESTYDYKSQSGRYSAGTEADYQAMEVLAPVVTAATPLPFIDLGLDVAGMAGGQAIDDAWDEKTKFQSPLSQGIRDVTGVIVPTIVGSMALGPMAGSAAFRATGGSAIARGLAKVFTTAAVDVGVVGVSDYSERDEGIAASLDGFLDDMGNPLGMDIPDAWQVMDGDSPPVRRQKLMMESGIFSLVGDALGYLLQRGKGPMEWMIPKEEIAENYKLNAILENPDPYSVKRTHEIDEELLLANQTRLGKFLSKNDGEIIDAKISQLQQEKDEIIDEVTRTGNSRVTEDPLESYVQRQDASRDWQTDEIGSRKLMADPQYTKYDPDIQSELADPSQTVRFSSPPGAAARNAADIATMELMPQKGVPTPVVTDPMLQDGLGVNGSSRDVIVSIAEDKSQAGVYDAAWGGMRFTHQSIEDSGWRTFQEILEAEDVDQLKSLFLDKRETRELAIGVQALVLKDPEAMQVGPALQALTSMYLDGDVAKTSARVMKTTGLEIEAISESLNKFKGAVDPDRATQIITDKMSFLFEEYGLNKSLAGWSLANKRWWGFKRKSPKAVYDEISELVTKNRENAMNMHSNMKRLMQQNPEAAHTLAMAYDLTNGEVDTLVKMTKWARKQMNLGSLLINTDGKLNIFAKGLKQIRFNNVLSGLSAMTATVGNGSALILKPAEYMLGAGVNAFRNDWHQLRAGLYAFNSFDAQGPALKDAFEMFKKASNDPQSVMDRIRKDYQLSDDASWEVLDRIENLALKEGNTGDAFMIRWARQNRNLGQNPVMRWGTNAMLGIDTYSNTLLATANSKFRAYDEVLSGGGDLIKGTLDAAAKKHYNNIFDERGMIKDAWLKHTSGELALNADTDIAKSITQLTNEFPPLTPFFMFPNTGVNWVRKSLTYLPVANLVDSRTRKTLLAGNNQEKIIEALREHNINASTEPQFMMIYKNLKAEYMGRLAMGTGLTLGLAQHALAGNIRGNLPPGKQDQRFWRQNNITPKQINVFGKWISFDGIPPFDPVLSIIGDMALHANSISPKSIEDTMGQIAWTFAQSFTASTPIEGLDPLVKLVGGDRGAAVQRYIANEMRSMVPLSGLAGVTANAISSTQKDIYNDWRAYLMNRLPGVNTLLPEQIDPWTGDPIRDIEDPMLRIINAVTPVKVSAGKEEWRQWLLSTGFNDTVMLNKDSSNSYKYSSTERAAVMKYFKEQQLWRKVEKMSKNPKYKMELDILRNHRNSGKDSKVVELPTGTGEIYTELSKILSQGKERAEQKALANGDIPIDTILGARLAKKYLRFGNTQKAINVQQETLQQQ